MLLSRIILAGALALAFTKSARAENVDFNGVVGNAYTITVNSQGTLDSSSDGQTLGSEEGIGAPADIDIVSFGDNNLTVTSPSVITNPPGYDNTNETVEVRYQGSGGLSALSQGYTSSPTANAIGATSFANVIFNARIVNPDGFASGNYAVSTIVTCAP